MWGKPDAGKRFLATVMFTDIVGSTDIATEIGDRRWRELLARHHGLVRKELKRFGGREIDTAGDGFFATFEAPAAGIRCACAASEAVHELGVDIRAGIHVGECELMGKKVGGIAVHTGARVLSVTGPGEVLVTATAKDLVAGSGIDFSDHGSHALKGLPGEWRLFLVTGVDGRERPVPLDPGSAARLRDQIAPPPLLRSRRIPIVVAGAVLLLAVVVGGFLLTRHSATIVPSANTLAEITAGSHGFSRAIAVGGAPTGVASGEGSIWVVNRADGTVQRIDPNASEPIVATKSTFGPPTGIGAGEGAAWITTGFGTAGGTSSGGKLYRYDPASNEVTPAADDASGKAVAVGDGAVWVADDVNGQVLRIDAKTAEVTPIPVGGAPIAIAIGAGAQAPVWLADSVLASLSRIDASTNLVERFNLGSVPSGIAVDARGDVWVTSAQANTVTRLDASGHARDTITGLPAGPTGIAVSADAVWIATTGGRSVMRIDPATDKVVETFSVSGIPSGIAVDPAGNLWVTVRAE